MLSTGQKINLPKDCLPRPNPMGKSTRGKDSFRNKRRAMGIFVNFVLYTDKNEHLVFENEQCSPSESFSSQKLFCPKSEEKPEATPI